MVEGGNLDPTPGEAAVNDSSRGSPTASYTQNFWISGDV
jgi:hypothetical protein